MHKVSALAAAMVAAAAPAAAQDGGNIDLNYFRPAMDSRGYITVNASEVIDHTDVSFGLVTNWGRNVLRFENGSDVYAVENVVSPTLVGAFGLGLGPIGLELGVSLPFNIMSGDRDPDDPGDPGVPNDGENFTFSGQGMGDLGLHLKLQLLNTTSHPVGFAVIGSVNLPTASEEDAWIGEGETSPQVLGVIDRVWDRQRRLRTAVTGGIRIRSGDHVFTDNMSGMGVPTTGQTIEAGSMLPFGAGLAYAISRDKFDVVAEVFGALPLDGEEYFPLEAVAGFKVYLARNSYFTLGGGAGFLPDQGANPDLRAFLGIVFEPNIGDRDGDGIKDNKDQCPDDPEDRDGFQDEDGCPDPDNDQDGILDEDDDCPNDPEDLDGIEDEDGCPEGERNDRDGDGIYDDEDQCPDDPEDKDGFEDEDGCPDPDNDQDGILDVDDLCPNQPEDMDNFEDQDGCPDTDNDRDRILDEDDQCPRVDGESREDTAETYNGVDDEDGCPDRGRVIVTDTKIEILDKIYFEYDSDVIKSRSFPILDAIVATLNGNPDILEVEIQGHTDERGSDSYNLDLSDRRAKSVRRYLSEHGVDGGRLQAQGYGETQPIDPRSNERAWAKNRRVEFLILKRSGE
jgi:outer membrane protein OmpA-like peptidoglycan-associated protein